MMNHLARRQSTGVYRMMISALIVGILFTHHALHGSASEHQQYQQEASIDPSGQMKFSSSNKAVDEVAAIKAAAVDAVPEAEVDAVPEAEVDAFPEAEANAVSEAEADAVSEAEVDAVPEAEIDAVSEAEVDAVPEAEVGSVPEAEVDAVSEAEVGAVSEAEVDAVSEAEVDAVSEAEVDAVPEAEVGSVPEAEVDHPAGGGMETCVDVSLIEKEREDLQVKLAAAEERLLTLQEEVESREADHFAELGSCGTDKETLLKEVETARGEAGELKEAMKETQALAEKATAADATQKDRDEAARLAAEQHAKLKSDVDAFQSEILDLRKQLSEEKAKALEAWKEVEKYANGKEEVRLTLERTASELEIARKPRKVSVSAILVDLRYLFDELVHQSADARDDIVSKGTVLSEKAIKAIQPYWKAAREVVDPQLEKAMLATAPQREKVAEVIAKYSSKIDDAVMKPAGEKWAEISSKTSKVAHQAWVKWQAIEADLHQRLINAGLSKNQTDKVTKYAYFGVMATVAVILLFYLVKPVLSYVVIPLIRTVLRWALWLIYLPIRILLVWPVMLIVWLLTRSFRLLFGKRAGKGPKPPASKAPKASKGRGANGKSTTGTSGKKKR